ncbi:carbohydrate ABC transporter permease [Rhizomonospora bruguierae]|uniref:carbohydrate ABC transporter permease n=1 Tax=Rhizomonospora bruguierae TaxID=1581705 RepID=UPI001BCDFEC3|nr:sugar ABC transporter permease [Micromonospora sp. NBRC 107566]
MSALGELRTLARGRPKGPPGLRSRKPRNEWVGYLFLTPWMVGILGITVIPMLASLYLSFTDYRLTRRRSPRFIGLDNYERMFTDANWLDAVGVTLRYVVFSVPLQLAVALGLALLLDRGLRGLPFYRSVFYLPSLLGGSVAVAILWKQVFGYEGLFNAFTGLFGVAPKGWVSSPDTALWTLILLHIWTFGAPMIIFLAGLRQIPRMYYEAAEVDGAGRWRQFRSITLPLLSPIIFFNLVLQVIGAFQSFTQAYVISGGAGLPANSTLFYSLYLYQQGFGSFQMGYASAMAWVLLLTIAAVTGLFFATSRFWVFYED